MSIRVLLAFALMTVFAPTPAAADVAPPPEIQTCTVEKQQHSGETCRTCKAAFDEADKCAKSLGVTGYVRRCQTTGASVWSEVWCRANPAQGSDPSSPESLPPKVPGATGGCGSCSGTPFEPVSAGAPLLLAGVIALVTSRRRRLRAEHVRPPP